MNREKLQERNEAIKQEQILISKEIKALPKAKFTCNRNGTGFKWYKTDENGRVYIPKTNRVLAEKLAYRTYLECRARDLNNEKKANDAYLRFFPKEEAIELLLDEGYGDLLCSMLRPVSKELEIWKNESYEKSTKYPDQLIHQTTTGSYVRSKSEMLIDMALYTNKIPFRYECALDLDGTKFYPDFTIRHPGTGEIYYWEHFGMADIPSYAQNMCQKINLYSTHGIIPSINLIMTFETKGHPLNLNKIYSIIHEYFL